MFDIIYFDYQLHTFSKLVNYDQNIKIYCAIILLVSQMMFVQLVACAKVLFIACLRWNSTAMSIP